MILHLAVSVEHRPVTNTDTHHYGVHRASMTSCSNKNCVYSLANSYELLHQCDLFSFSVHKK